MTCYVWIHQCMSDRIMRFWWRMWNMWTRLIFIANMRVMRSLGWLNRFLIRSGIILKAVRTLHNHQLRLKCLDSLRGFHFINICFIKDWWPRNVKSKWINSWSNEWVKRSWQPWSENSRIASTSSWSDESYGGVNKEQNFSPFEFIERKYDRLGGFKKEILVLSTRNDGLTSCVSYEWSKVETFRNEFSQEK